MPDEHRTMYPEQYAHPLCGKRVSVTCKVKDAAVTTIIPGTVERVVNSQWGPLAKLADDDSGTWYAVSDCTVVDSHINADTATGATSFVGRTAVDLFVITTLASAMRFYAKTGMQVNRAYTPKAMLAKASTFTGKAYKTRGQLVLAAGDLEKIVTDLRATLPVVKS